MIGKDYKIIAELGTGQTGKVKLATVTINKSIDELDNRMYAFKMPISNKDSQSYKSQLESLLN